MADTNAEVMRVTTAGPIMTLLERSEEILAINYEGIEKLARILESVASCGGFGCGHGAEPLKKTPPPEDMKALVSGPIVAVLDRREEILAMKHEDVEKVAKLVDAVSWCGGFGCGHGTQAITPASVLRK